MTRPEADSKASLNRAGWSAASRRWPARKHRDWFRMGRSPAV